MNQKINKPLSTNIILFGAGILVFAWFIHATNASRLIGLAALVLPCIALYRHTLVAQQPMYMLHTPDQRFFKASLLAGLLLGTGMAVYYRMNIGALPLPASITLFAPVALLIGISEEFVFRGAAFYLVKKWPVYITITLTALLHAAYKTMLFLQPEILHPVDTWFLFYTTFLAGLVIGFLRYAGGSVIPAMAAHGIWDLLVYGDSAAAPWWVW